MDRVAEAVCEWGVNTLGNVLVALPRFHAEVIDHARLYGNEIVFHHDWFRRTAAKVPDEVLGHLLAQPSILLVVCEADGDFQEKDLPVRHMGDGRPPE